MKLEKEVAFSFMFIFFHIGYRIELIQITEFIENIKMTILQRPAIFALQQQK